MPKTRVLLAVALMTCCATTYCPSVRAEAPSGEVCVPPKVAVPRPADPAQWSAWVDQRIKDLQPMPQERKFDRIGWSRTILDAERLAKAHDRPVFLFTHDGRINTGRC